MRWMLAAVAAMGLAGGAMAQPAAPSMQSDTITRLLEEAATQATRSPGETQAALLGAMLAGQEYAATCRRELANSPAMMNLRADIVAKAAEIVRAAPANAAAFENAYTAQHAQYLRATPRLACENALSELIVTNTYIRSIR